MYNKEKTYINCIVSCINGGCSSEGKMVFHRLICPICESVVWEYSQEKAFPNRKPKKTSFSIEEFKNPNNENDIFEAFEAIAVHTTLKCCDCGYEFENFGKCLICGKGQSVFEQADYTFPNDIEVMKEFFENKRHRSLIQRSEYIRKFEEAKNQLVNISPEQQ